MTDHDYMLRAIELALLGKGHTNPNPMVGAVIVKDDRIIGEGYHRRCGELHAERNAFASLTESAQGATIYVTLEPCCHYGKTPPCTEAIIENKIAKVVIGSSDPNPLVSGKGANILSEHGIEVVQDFMKEECDRINPVFFHYITKKTPYVAMKYAMTLDGKIATREGKSKWITSAKAREHVQSLRGTYYSIMAGIGTVLADDPMLNCRIEGAHQPVRIIADSSLRIKTDCKLVETAREYKTIVATALDRDHLEINVKDKTLILEAKGVQILYRQDYMDNDSQRVDLKKLLIWMGQNGIDSVLIEGGGEINEAVLKTSMLNKLYVYIAPKLFGGREAKTPIEGLGFGEVEEATLMKLEKISTIGEDVLLEYRL